MIKLFVQLLSFVHVFPPCSGWQLPRIFSNRTADLSPSAKEYLRHKLHANLLIICSLIALAAALKPELLSSTALRVTGPRMNARLKIFCLRTCHPNKKKALRNTCLLLFHPAVCETVNIVSVNVTSCFSLFQFLRSMTQLILKAHANGHNIVGQQHATLLGSTCCVCLRGTTTMLAPVAYSLKPVKLLDPCKRTQHCWPN